MAEKNDTTFFENKLLDFVTAKDPMLEMLQWEMDKFMEIEVAHKTGAEKGIHPESRTGYRCGYRIRCFDTRLGTVYLSVPKIRQGGYIPFFVTEKKRSEQALIQVVQECWLNGVSTRKIEKIAKRLGIETLSASEVSEINNGLDEMVDEFRSRKLEAEYPVIWADALYEKIRDNHRIASKAVMVIKAVNLEGKAVECLEEGFEDSVQFYAFEELDSRKISSTNTLERLNREIRRRSSVVGIFPSTDSYIRLITSYLLEYSEDWQTERCYINASSIKVQKEILFNAA